MCVYLRFKLAGRLFVCVRLCSELVTEVCAEELIIIEFHNQNRADKNRKTYVYNLECSLP
jgi:hypothetical protein